ncbi:hypothetical protein MettiDRAFT_0795 [Methanolobus tindarius DSM 2278]|uniref:Uncharacterized protein n=1 Tax=Methanolobus tindarius DSM 2278 TaxID=1090322 RepID=W9DN37_METTI|nr:hypothetical protein MettiDRAFT_0795 [Methanolobus tindarius DSM 2278]
MIPTMINVTTNDFIIQGSTLHTSHALTMWILQNILAAFLLGLFMGLTGALFYESNKNYVTPWLFETAIPWIVGKINGSQK